MVLIISGSDGPDSIAISHIVKLGFLMSSDFVISKSRSLILHAENERSRSLLTLMATIKSRDHISRFWGSCCQVNWTFQSPDPRFSDETSYRASPSGARSLPRIHTNGQSRSYRDFATVVVPMHMTLRTLISQWMISRCLSGLLFLLLRLISLTASADLTVVDDPAPNLTALAAFNHSLLSIIHLSKLFFYFPVIFTVAINDKHSLSVH
jgi:hypothetical protein